MASADEFEAFDPVSDPSTGKPVDEFSGFEAVDTSIGEGIAAFGRAATRGVAETGPAILGMTMGAQLGALTGPAAPVAVPLGAAAGAAAGYMFGKKAGEFVPDSQPSQLPEGQRTWAAAGETFGSGIPVIAAPMAFAQAGARLAPSIVGNYINRILDIAKSAPTTFATAELAGLSGSSVGAGVAEKYYPGEIWPRLGAEIAGGFFNPARILASGMKNATEALAMVKSALSPAARETRAAKYLSEVMDAAGEDPDLLARLLTDPALTGLKPTAAMKVDSPALAALEKKLASDSAKFFGERAARAEDNLDALNVMIQNLRGTGDPAAMRVAADMQSKYFRMLIAGRIASAENELAQAASKLTKDTPEARSALSVQANEALGNALEQARGVERELWSKIPQDFTPVKTDSIKQAADRIRSEMLPEEKLPDIVEGLLARVAGGGDSATNSGELLKIRSRMLALAREADAQGKANDARIYGTIAEAALDDLDSLRAVFPEVDAARQFTRELHDAFTRTFAGTALSSAQRGMGRVPPELLMKQALGAGREAGELKLRQIEDATRFMVGRGGDQALTEANINTMLDAQERILRLAAADVINPETGRASSTRLGNFLRNNAALLERFPAVRDSIRDVGEAERNLRNVAEGAQRATAAIDARAAFSKAAKVENSADLIPKAISSDTPVQNLTSLVKLARKGGDASMSGLQTSVFDYALQKIGGTVTTDNIGDFKNALFAPVRQGQPSLVTIMQRENIMSRDQVSNLNKLITEVEKISTALSGGTKIDELSAPDGLMGVLPKIIGSKIAAAMPGQTTLIAQSAGAKRMEQIMNKVPGNKVSELLMEASKNPAMMAALLTKAKTEKEGFKVALQMHAYLLNAGIIAAEGGEQ